MPTEERLVIFRPTEVLDALKDFQKRKDRPMPRGSLEGLNFTPGEEPALVLEISATGSPMTQKIAFRQAEVAAALILYCKERAIPLPKSSKTLVSHDGTPAFRICF